MNRLQISLLFILIVVVSSWVSESVRGADTKAWPHWDGHESMQAYAQRTGQKATELIDLGGVSLELVLVPAGEFEMGRGTGTAPEEKPLHKVTITQPFYMGKYELTQEQYEKVMGTNPSSFRNPKNPVENVSWDDAMDFCKKLGATVKRTFQLPTEAQWEYACRAGTNKNEDGPVFDEGWHDNSGFPRHPHTVGEKKSNAWGLHDVYGNVREWCSDWYDENYYANSPKEDPQGPATGSFRVLRSGCWSEHVAQCMPACRHKLHPISRYYFNGFRIVVPITK